MLHQNDVSLRYAFIKSYTQKTNHSLSIKDLCHLSKISRSGYYSWLKKANARQLREENDQHDFDLILAAYEFRGYDKGSRGIHMRLLRMGTCMNRKKIQRLMRKYNLLCPIRKPNPYKRMAKAIRTNAVADNHVKREFRKHGARKVLLTDITYIPYNKKFYYLSVIKDAYTMQILSYVLSESLEVDFVLQTVNQLVEKHGITLNSDVLIHSDQGCHYTSVKYRELINNYGLRQSMSRKGNCWDNAPQESFFGHMKCELLKKMSQWHSFETVKADIDDWIDYYNNDRYQWQLEKLSPNEYFTFITTGTRPTLTA